MSIFWAFLFLGFLNFVFCENRLDSDVTEKISQNSRQKRLLFYDEEGNLVKLFTNPYLRDSSFNLEKIWGRFFNPFLALFQPPSLTYPVHYMIPVSNEVIQQINNDPVFQNKLMILPSRHPNVKANPLCNGKRNQIPSPNICNNFYNCWDGWAFEQECPAGLLFSTFGYCDYPHNVNCFDRNVIVSDATQMQSEQDKPVPQPQSPLQPQPQPPQQSLAPLQSQPETPSCQTPSTSQPGAPSFPNPLQQQIQLPQTPLQTQPETPLLQTPPPVPLVYFEPKCNQDFETFRNPFDCGEFFVCSNQQPYRFQCPADLAYNEELGICDYRERVDCKGFLRTLPSSQSSATASEKKIDVMAPVVPNDSNLPVGIQTNFAKSSFNSESWSTTHIAMSRQEAIRQLQG